VAQLLAAIPDALPKEYVEELVQLQANAPAMGWPFVRRRGRAENDRHRPELIAATRHQDSPLDRSAATSWLAAFVIRQAGGLRPGFAQGALEQRVAADAASVVLKPSSSLVSNHC
jgi:hypothetical protein